MLEGVLGEGQGPRSITVDHGTEFTSKVLDEWCYQNGVTLDFMETVEVVLTEHYAFLVSEAEFDQIFSRIQARDLPYWADPFHKEPGRINHWDDGRGLYFDDPNGHLLEVITRPYGSGGIDAKHPNPLLPQKR